MNTKEGIRIINYVANQAHGRHLDIGAALILVFQEKTEEAADFIAAGYPKDLTSWPFIHADKEALGISAKKAADDIIKTKAEWVAIAAQVERIRIKAILDLRKRKANVDKVVHTAVEQLNRI